MQAIAVGYSVRDSILSRGTGGGIAEVGSSVPALEDRSLRAIMRDKITGTKETVERGKKIQGTAEMVVVGVDAVYM